MWLNREIDLPAIAKRNSIAANRHIVVYSPFAHYAFYNCNTPCFHADPCMARIDPAETRWTTSFFIL